MKRKELYNYIREEIISELTNENITVTKDSTIQAAAVAAKGEGITDSSVVTNTINYKV